MVTTEQYNELIEFCQAVILQQKLSSALDNYDIVHDAILDESKSYQECRSAIISLIKNYRSQSKNIFDIDSIGDFNESANQKTQIQYRTCKKCGETMSEEFFVIGFSKQHQCTLYRNYCRPCHNQIRKTYKKSDKAKARDIERQKNMRARQKQLYGRIIDKNRNERGKKFWEKEKNAISDKYIIRLIRRRSPKEKITEKMILDKRNHIIQSRKNKI